MERSFVMAKPDAVQRGLVGEIIARFEKKGLKLVAAKMTMLSSEILRQHYAHIADKPFYPGVEKFMMSGPVVMMAWEGLEAVEVIRKVLGPTNARTAEAGTLRGDLAMSMQCNLVHASDSVETAQVELGRMFAESDYVNYQSKLFGEVYAEDEQGK